MMMPIMRERAQQALVKFALEPAWEAVFEPSSYGFRPGRSCHDAIGHIFLAMRKEQIYRGALITSPIRRYLTRSMIQNCDPS